MGAEEVSDERREGKGEVYPQTEDVVASITRYIMESVAPVASFTRAKTYSPGVMKEPEVGTDHVKVPLFWM